MSNPFILYLFKLYAVHKSYFLMQAAFSPFLFFIFRVIIYTETTASNEGEISHFVLENLSTAHTGDYYCGLGDDDQTVFSRFQLEVSGETNLQYESILSLHYDVIKWKHFPRYCPLVRGIHRSPVDSPNKGTVTRTFGVSLLPVGTNC